MAKKKKSRRTQRKADTWRSKKWYTITTPEAFDRVEIGETLADDPDKLVGRVMETTLGDIISDFSKQNIKLKFRINGVAGDTATTKFLGHELTRDYMRSLVKRRTSKIDANIKVTTKDGYTIRVKPSAFTIKRAQSSQIKAIRNLMHEIVTTKAKEMDFANFIEDAVAGKLASEIYREAKNIYPMRRVEIVKTEVEAEPMTTVLEEPVVAETPEATEASTETSEVSEA